MGVFASLAALIGSAFLKHFTVETVKFVAFRAFMIALCLGLGPVVLFKGYSYIIGHAMSYASTYLGSQGMEGVSMTISGFGGWLASHLRIGEAISLYLSFCLLSVSLRIARIK